MSSRTRSISHGASTNVAVWWWNVGSKPRVRASSHARATPSAKRVHPASSRPIERSAAARPGKANPFRRAPVCEHRLCLTAISGRKEIECCAHGGEVFGPVLRLAEPNRDVATYERESVVLEALVERESISEIAGRAQLGPLVAGACDRAQHALCFRHVGEHADRDLERAIAARRVRHADAGQRRRPSSVTSGTRGSGSRSAQAGLIHARAGSSAEAMERRSPASPLR